MGYNQEMYLNHKVINTIIMAVKKGDQMSTFSRHFNSTAGSGQGSASTVTVNTGSTGNTGHTGRTPEERQVRGLAAPGSSKRNPKLDLRIAKF